MRTRTSHAVIVTLAILGSGEPTARAEEKRAEPIKVSDEVMKHLGERTVVVDFEGYHLYVVARDAEGKEIHTATGGFLFNAKTMDVDNGVLFARVKARAREALPKDADIKALGG